MTRATIEEVHHFFSDVSHFGRLRHVILNPKTILEKTETAIDRMNNLMA